MPKKVEKSWKTIDLNKVIREDLQAAISVLDLILQKPELYDIIVKAVEDWRSNLLEQERRQSNGKSQPVS